MENIILEGAFALVLCSIGCWAYAQNYHHNNKDEFTYLDLGEEYYDRRKSRDTIIKANNK